MAKRKHREEQELPFVALMDTMTNVVGVLVIVLVMVGISISSVVKNILSDLPPVTQEEYQKMVEVVKQLPPPPADPKQIEEDKKIAEQKLKKAIEDLKTIDTTSLESQMKFMDLESFHKKLAEAKKQRESQKVEVDKLIVEVERLKALLDQTPIFKPEPPTYIRLPNPRPFPAKPNETRVLVAKQGVLYLNEKTFTQPIIEGLEKVKSQFEYKEVKIDSFAKMLTEILGNPQAAQQAWVEIAPLVNTFQMDQVALAYKTLTTAKVPATKQVLSAIGDLSIATRSTLPVVAEAIVAAVQGNLTKWSDLDPSADPAKPIIEATSSGSKITFSWGVKAVEVKATPRDVLDYFVKDLAGMTGIKDRSQAKVIYDAFKLQAILERAAVSPMMSSSSYTFKPSVKPGITLVQLALTPKAGGGETLEQMRGEGSTYQRLMRAAKADENGVVVFQVMADAFQTYHEARQIADQIGVAATWEFLPKLDLLVNVTGYEVQRFTAPAVAKPVVGNAVRIAVPKRTLD
ncbi:MAG: hypothetical protein NTV80_21945 [Verrucomicrobia bacterium]|nr:hypothetical protein [Verrucomicrobiota bacterium]